MASGDVGGAITQLVITCRTPKAKRYPIEKGHPVALCGAYAVTEEVGFGDPIFGQALEGAKDDVPIPIKVSGICIFEYQDGGRVPIVGEKVMLSAKRGKVIGVTRSHAYGQGVVLKVDSGAFEVHVLL